MAGPPRQLALRRRAEALVDRRRVTTSHEIALQLPRSAVVLPLYAQQLSYLLDDLRRPSVQRRLNRAFLFASRVA